MAVDCSVYLCRICRNVTENGVVFFTVICHSTVELNQVTTLYLVHLLLVKCHSDIANWCPGRHLGTAHHPPFPPGCIPVTGLRTSGKVSMCLFVCSIFLFHIWNKSRVLIALHFGSLCHLAWHTAVLWYYWEKKTCSCGPSSLCSGAAFI